jgi:hypothetical protein
MNVTAKYCVPAYSPSGWVFNWILTCDNELAVTFHSRRHGNVCCLYPGTTEQWFDLAISWPLPGKFVHKFLYKKMPYRLIASPCPPTECNVQTKCCTNTLPATLHATLTNLNNCQCASGTVTLTWNEAAGAWTGYGLLGTCGEPISLAFSCHGTSASGFQLQVVVNSPPCQIGPVTLSPVGTPTCNPLNVQFHVAASPNCGCGSAGFFTVTVTL